MVKFTDIKNWSDEECEKFDKSSKYFKISISRNLLKAYDELEEKYAMLAKEYDDIWDIILTGRLYGYLIKCPYCGVEYNILHQELNRQQIRCMDCGNWYSQTREIKQLTIYRDNNNDR